MSRTIRIGILHSLQGPMAMDELPLVDAALIAVEEINEQGGLLGKKIEAIIADGHSDDTTFARSARELIEQNEVRALFGCWTSSSRKAVKKVVEEKNALLWYPLQYEGLEQSPNIVYTGSCLNQQITPVVDWILASGKRRVALVGSDYVFPRTANKLAVSMLVNSPAKVVHESYHPLTNDDFVPLMEELKKCRPDAIINTINGQGNIAFLDALQQEPELAHPDTVCSISCSEVVFSRIKRAEGQLACWGYFQSVATPENRAFLSRLHRRGKDISSDPIATAYSQVLLWASIVERIGSARTEDVLANLAGSALDTPLGRLEIQPNHHVMRNALIGRSNDKGQFDVIWKSDDQLAPLPWLGVENADLPFKQIVLQLLRELPDDITISARLKAEVDLRKAMAKVMAKNQRRLKESEEVGRIGGFERNYKTGEGYWSDMMFHLLGHEPGDFTPSADRFVERVMEGEREGFRQAFEACIANARDLDYQCRIKRADGEIRHLQVHIVIIHDGKGHVDRYHGTIMDITERALIEEALRASELKMRTLAQEDELTGIFNRRHFMDLTRKEVQRAGRYPAPFSLIMFDVDHFKRVNDTHGHAIGDVVLKAICKCAKEIAREVDILGRLGGEEFALALPNTNLECACTVAERLRQAIDDMDIHIKNKKLHCTISLGVAERTGCATDVDSILKAADIALYRAKETGRNKVEKMLVSDMDEACAEDPTES